MSQLTPAQLPIDVLLATARRPRLLRRSILSVIRAARKSAGKIKIRFVVASSGPVDETPAVLAQLRTDYPEFEILHTYCEQPLGAASARNRVLHLCVAEWLYFIDDDAYVD